MFILSIISNQPANFRGEVSWPANLWKGLKVGKYLKTELFFLLFVDKNCVYK